MGEQGRGGESSKGVWYRKAGTCTCPTLSPLRSGSPHSPSPIPFPPLSSPHIPFLTVLPSPLLCFCTAACLWPRRCWLRLLSLPLTSLPSPSSPPPLLCFCTAACLRPLSSSPLPPLRPLSPSPPLHLNPHNLPSPVPPLPIAACFWPRRCWLRLRRDARRFRPRPRQARPAGGYERVWDRTL